jgi:tetratricopeptide (TPR) repeat protein
VDEACRQTGELYYASRARVQLARLLASRGDLDGAEREVRKATDYPQARPVRAYAGAVLSTILLAQGRPEGALAAATEGKRLFDALGAVHEGDALIHLALAEALEATGHPSARAALAGAHHRLLERAATIEDPALHTSFLEDVRDHARTLAVAGERLDAPRADPARVASGG